LHKGGVDADRGKIARIPHLRKKTAGVTNAMRHQHFNFR
jgi:hypothetical protein